MTKYKNIGQSRVLDTTLSCCSICHKIIPAKIIEKDGKIFLEKKCCKKELVLIENDAKFYKKWILPQCFDSYFFICKNKTKLENLKNYFLEESPSFDIEATPKCNLSCPICFEEQYSDFFSIKEIKLQKIRSSLKKYKSKAVILTGGEITTRKDLSEIVKIVIESGNIPLITTNGLKLCDMEFVRKLKNAGLRNVNLSFDGFDDNVNKLWRKRKLLKYKLKALENLKKEGIDTWLFVTVDKNVNGKEVPKILKYARLNKDFIKGVLFTPLILKETTSDITTISDIYKILERGIGVSTEYFMEVERLCYNLYKIAKKYFGNSTQKKLLPLTRHTVRLKIHGKDFKPLFKKEVLKELNSTLETTISEDENFIFLIKNFGNFLEIFSLDILKLLWLIVLSKFELNRAYLKFKSSKNIMRIRVSPLSLYNNIDFKRYSPHGNISKFCP